jgi:hypothetical protein
MLEGWDAFFSLRFSNVLRGNIASCEKEALSVGALWAAAERNATVLGDSRVVDHNLLSEPQLPGVYSRNCRWNWVDNPGVQLRMYSEKEGL